MDKSASSPPSGVAAIGTPITGSGVSDARNPGSADAPAAGVIPFGHWPVDPPDATETLTKAIAGQPPTPGHEPPCPAATSSGTRSPGAHTRNAWHSGSPKRQLNSRTFGPSAVSMSPT